MILVSLLIIVSAGAEDDAKIVSSPLEKEMNSEDCSRIGLPFNLLQTDVRDISLFRDISFNLSPNEVPSNVSYSQVVCQNAFDQRVPPGFDHLGQTARLNMIAQIPELGVVVIGNQVGRVGILTMIRWTARKQSGYKIEAILPSRSEEMRLRPRTPLLGMAVGPVQGQETPLPFESPKRGAQNPRRFRILMMYCDHTIMGYEIFRPDGEEDIRVV